MRLDSLGALALETANVMSVRLAVEAAVGAAVGPAASTAATQTPLL